jgi:FkbM family methyltransferase
MDAKSNYWNRRALRRFGDKITGRARIEGTWIDVGAHHGETTLRYAKQNPDLRIFALEPNLSAAAKLMGRATNYFVIPLAIAEKNGIADFHVNAFDAASSLLPFNEGALQSWIGGETLRVNSVIAIPTMRLDTFMDLTAIQSVDYLKIDTQGMDLAVVKSAGQRLRDIARITLEVDVKPVPLYSGAPSKNEVVAFLKEAGFSLVTAEKQSHNQEENLTFIRKDLVPRLRDGESSTSVRVERSK